MYTSESLFISRIHNLHETEKYVKTISRVLLSETPFNCDYNNLDKIPLIIWAIKTNKKNPDIISQPLSAKWRANKPKSHQS